MKVCREGHRHNDYRCMECNRAACAARYIRFKEQLAVKAKAERAEYKALKAAANSLNITESEK